MIRIFVFLLSFMFIHPAFAQDKAAKSLDACMNKLEAHNSLNVDAPAYCGCLSKFYTDNPAVESLTQDEETKTKYKAHVDGCMQEYYKPKLVDLCTDMNGKMLENHVDCDCLYTEMSTQMLDMWLDEGGNEAAVTKELVMKATEEALMKCVSK